MSVLRPLRRLLYRVPGPIRHPLTDLGQGLARGTRNLVRGRLTSLPVEAFQVPGHDTFFGYYDRIPEAPDGTAVLAHAVPANGQTAAICLFEQGGHRVIGQTDLWSWQLGARLGWVESAGTPPTIIYNAHHDGGPGTVLADREGRELSRYRGCLYDVAPDGSFGLGLDMARLGWARPGYGYPALDDPTRDTPLPEAGVFRLDLATGQRTELAFLPEIASLDPRMTFQNAVHYLNHISISPDGARFLVYHLWIPDPSDPDQFEARVLLGDCAGGPLTVLEDRGRPSHYTWQGPEEVILFRIGPEDSGYRRYQIADGTSTPFWNWVPQHDGHQSFSPADPGLFLMDTYPGRWCGEQELHLYHRDGSGGVVQRFRADPRLEGAARCDLHPRWSRDGKSVYIDSSCGGARQVLRVGLERLSG